MFCLADVKERYFEMQHPVTSTVLHILPPTLEQLRAVENPRATVLDVEKTVAEIIARNKEGVPVDADDIGRWMNYDQLTAFVVALTKWLRAARANNPN